MYDVVGVRFKKAGKIYYFDPGELTIADGEYVIVETIRGIEFGKVVINKKQVSENDVVLPLKKVIRVADPKDRLIVEENKNAAKEAYDVCVEKVLAHSLDMKLVDVEYTFDRNKVIFYFTADGRIDFRELVKDLAAIFRTRIELRQIGVRDEAKLLGGIGPCGRMLCCSTFLGDFEPVSIKMAKDQNLSLNPTKISGLCGRLMCCLKYENDEYETAKEQLPDVGEVIATPNGQGRVIGLNILERILQIELVGKEQIVEFTLDELTKEGAVSFQSTE
ncbi:PSP1 domain-containing protein [Priestia koreensis]|uniref:Stage 0 sporulation protein n=1 Tax=Priestia koreensis TaxID=284581 RepID=A0A0M0KUQ5_9BACI|nr:stage 0 sporulation family protein [Priestia koreensis]KOO42362.1 stage 0 sporulation protein [Priestia koreensis]MCM3006890.1 stage 0 sporulation family protein [Priestia koreensis]UNL85059.1 stage 0 sporulation family protein [Priestia koreensis]